MAIYNLLEKDNLALTIPLSGLERERLVSITNKLGISVTEFKK